jgi:hypothetical protein
MMKLYTGCVEDRNDPLKLGRCKVRIVGLHTESKVTLPTDDLPWAYPISPITSAGTSGIGTAPLGPVEGTWVLITFMDPDEQMPMMLGTMIGAYQTPEALKTGQFTIDEADAAGNVDLTGSKSIPQNADGTIGDAAKASDPYGGQAAVKDGKVVTEPGKIVGPLGGLIAKAESGKDGYNAFNRGTANGAIIPAGGKLDLTKMPIKEIMAKQALPPGSPDRLFAVGKYQCIPVTLKAACQALNIDINEPFSEKTQDIICQEYLVAKKRPALVAYYRNPNKNDEKLLMDAGQSLAAEFASIEDPYFLGYPYKGPNGSYYKSGNRAHTMWKQIKATLQSEWEFRNDKKNPPPTATIADNDKVDKGTDYSGVAKQVPADDSIATEATPSVAAEDSPIGGDFQVPELPQIPDIPIPAVPDVATLAGATNLDIGGISSAINSVKNEFGDVLGSVSDSFASLAKDLKLDAALDSVLGSVKGISSDASTLLSGFGSNLSDISKNLGIENISGSPTELAANLGLVNPSQEAIVQELAKKAGSQQGQAASLLSKLEAQGEPTKKAPAAFGEKNPDGTISNGTGVDPTKGFQDPNGVYPKYKNEPDTNRLATGNNLGRTIVLKKEASLKSGVRIANGGTWDQSPNPYNAQYPFNKVTQTESGHVQEWDDTPGSERIHTYHKSGTFSEIDANGTQVNRIVGDGFQVMERNGFIYVKGAYCVTVDGAMNLRTDNVFNLEVSGAANIKVYNDANIDISGDCNLAVGKSLNAKANKVNLESVGQFNIKAGTGLNVEAGKDINIKTGASINTQAKGNIGQKASGGISTEAEGDVNILAAGVVNAEAAADFNIKSGALANIEAAGDANFKAGGNANVEGSGETNIKAGGTVAVDGSIVDLGNGAGSAGSASGASAAPEARPASFAELELPVETRGTSGVDRLPPLAIATRGSENGLDAPGKSGEADSGASAYQNKRVQNNTTSKSAVEATTYEKQRETPNAKSAATTPVPPGMESIMNMPADQFTAGMKLSKHFTLGDLTKGGVRIPRVTYNVKGVSITPQQIVANLKNFAVNVLDPIRDKFGPFVITSCFRRPPFGAVAGDLGPGTTEGGDHPIGCAADIVFTGGGRQETFNKCNEIAKMLPSWNQIIMEYNGPQFWIHVSCRPQGNKGDMFTMVANKTYQGTFPRGGFILV